MRKKEVTIDGAKFVISPLTLEQVDLFVIPITAENGERAPKVEERARQLVAWGLENALRDDNFEFPDHAKPWDAERVRKQIDLKTFMTLQEEILTFSELRKEDSTGELKAATGTESTSSKSAAA